MAFSSVTFLFLFFPLTLLIWFACGARARLSVLVGLGLLFSFWGSGWLVMFLMGSVLFNYVFGLAIAAARTRSAGDHPSLWSKTLLGAGVVGNLLCLGYFKYLDFGIATLSVALTKMGLPPVASSATKTALPLGISFFTFKAVSYLIDVFRGDAAVARNPLHIGAYLTLFPQLTAGPIGRYPELGPQFAELRLPDATSFFHGEFRFVVGLAKKVLIADTLGVVADEIFGLDPVRVGVGGAWLGAVAYTFQIYFDFSGYSDMAIGIGRMLGLRFAENFDYPYISRSIREFWRRWHISLSTWFRDYLYIPLGGSRASRPRVYLNLLIVFTLCGLWHGANWTFVAWGLYHGLFLAAEHAGFGRALARAPRVAQHFYALVVVTVGWVFFRAANLDAALQFLHSMFAPADGAPLVMLAKYDSVIVKAAFAGAVLGSTPWMKGAVERVRSRVSATPGTNGHPPLFVAFQGAACAALVLLFLLSAMHLAAGSSTPFLYAQF